MKFTTATICKHTVRWGNVFALLRPHYPSPELPISQKGTSVPLNRNSLLSACPSPRIHCLTFCLYKLDYSSSSSGWTRVPTGRVCLWWLILLRRMPSRVSHGKARVHSSSLCKAEQTRARATPYVHATFCLSTRLF